MGVIRLDMGLAIGMVNLTIPMCARENFSPRCQTSLAHRCVQFLRNQLIFGQCLQVLSTFRPGSFGCKIVGLNLKIFLGVSILERPEYNEISFNTLK